MAFLAKKENGILLYHDLGGYETRNPATIWLMQQADKAHNWPDFPETKFCTDDSEQSDNDYTYSKKHGYNRLIPDFNFHSWPEVGIHDYCSFTEEISAAGKVPAEINKVGWIGCVETNHRRKWLLDISKRRPDLFDVVDMNWIRDAPTTNKTLKGTTYISTPELVRKYSMLIDIEGGGYSGRLKHLLWSRRPLLLVDRPHKEFFYEFLKEWDHYIPVKRDLSDLIEKTEWCIANYDQATQIAERAYRFCTEHLTREACYSQWNRIIINL